MLRALLITVSLALATSCQIRFDLPSGVGGSLGMSGAAVLCGSACLRGGAGLVQVAVPGEILATVASGNPCYMTTPLAQDMRGRLGSSAIDQLIAIAEDWADVVRMRHPKELHAEYMRQVNELKAVKAQQAAEEP